MSDSVPYSVPREPGRRRAIVLAAVVHAALFAFLWFGVRWQNDTPVAVEAEVWSPSAREAAPRAVTPPPAPAPEPEPPAPQPKPQPVREAPPQKVETPQEKAPDIALEREKNRLALLREKEAAFQAKKQAEKQAERRAEQEAERKEALAKLKTDEQRKQKLQQQQAEQTAAQKRLAQQQEADQKRIAQAADAASKKKADAEKKALLDKQRQQEALAERKLQAQHDEQVRRLTDSASASSMNNSSSVGSGGNGEAAKSQGARADASYTQKVGAKIKSNTIFNGADELSSNPSVEYAVELLPDGSIRRLRKTKSSGVPGFDEAVSRAIEKSQPFPPDKSGSVPSGFTVAHKPKDQ
ncbi:MAG: cell envelope integrity protein TolA [Herminiimonas sp.]|nr:cell envelope integrity protein TolA [Herminiimonas sp.]